MINPPPAAHPTCRFLITDVNPYWSDLDPAEPVPPTYLTRLMGIVDIELSFIDLADDVMDLKQGDLVVMVQPERTELATDMSKPAPLLNGRWLRASDSIDGSIMIWAFGVLLNGSLTEGQQQSRRGPQEILWFKLPTPVSTPDSSSVAPKLASRLGRRKVFGDSRSNSSHQDSILAEVALEAFEDFLAACSRTLTEGSSAESDVGPANHLRKQAQFLVLGPVLTLISLSERDGRLERFMNEICNARARITPESAATYSYLVCSVPAVIEFIDSDEPLNFDIVHLAEPVEETTDHLDVIMALVNSSNALSSLAKMPVGSSVICLPVVTPTKPFPFIGAVVDFEALVAAAKEALDTDRLSVHLRHFRPISSWTTSLKMGSAAEGSYQLDWAVPRHLHVLHPRLTRANSDGFALVLRDFMLILTKFCVSANKAAQSVVTVNPSPDSLKDAARLFLMAEEDPGADPVDELARAARARRELSLQRLRVSKQQEQTARLRDDFDREHESVLAGQHRLMPDKSLFVEPFDELREDLERVEQDLSTLIDHGSGNFQLIAARASVAIPAAQEGFNRRIGLVGAAFLAPGLVAALFGSNFKTPSHDTSRGFWGLIFIMLSSALATWSVVGLFDLPRSSLPRPVAAVYAKLRGAHIERFFKLHRPLLLMGSLTLAIGLLAIGLTQFGTL